MVQHSAIDHTGITGVGSTVATDAIWDAAGDLAVGSGANTAAKLTLGAVGGVVGRVNGAVAWNGGTSFPASKATSDRFARSDLAMEFYWDGTRWLSYGPALTEEILWVNGTLPISASAFGTHRVGTPETQGGSDIWLIRAENTFNVSGGTALSASHKWVGTVSKVAGAASTTIATVTIDSGASSTWRRLNVSIGALMNNGTGHEQFAVDWAKTGTPGNLFAFTKISYRIVAT